MTQVVSPGEYCVRGGLIDLFPMGSALPYRVDLFDDEIDTIRTFDADTQRTLYPVPEVRLLPAREFPLDEPGAHALPQPLARAVRRRSVEVARSTRTSATASPPAGIEYYLPLFFDATATLFDYLPRRRHARAARRRRRGVRSASGTDTRVALPAAAAATATGRCCRRASCSCRAEEFFARAKPFARVDIALTRRRARCRRPTDPRRCPPSRSTARADDPLAALQAYLDALDGRAC